MRSLFVLIAATIALIAVIVGWRHLTEAESEVATRSEIATPSFAEDDAQRRAEIERLTETYRSRLPEPLSRYRIAWHPGGVVDGVGVIDFELTDETLPLPPLIVAAGGANGGFWLGGPGHIPSSRQLGRALFAHGFSIRSLAYFGDVELPEFMGEEPLTPTLVERPLEPIAARVQEGRTTRDATRRCTGFIGVSKGGELTMLLAAYGDAFSIDEAPIFDAAVAVVPSHVVWQAPYVTARVRSGWSKGGEPMAFVRYPWLSIHTPSAFFNYPHVGALGEAALQNESAVEAAEIPIERAPVPVLMQGGRFDDVWPSSLMVDAALDRANRLNSGHQLEVIHYDLDHFVLASPEPVLDAVSFLYARLRDAAERGVCEADFLSLPEGVEQES